MNQQKKGGDATRDVLKFTFRHWREEPRYVVLIVATMMVSTLADVFMPQLSGYEVCEHIKQNDQLKHIPVMLLVGSFEPFDEAEARRVGANDTLTKPFQSIRSLIDKVGALVSGRAAEERIPTAELPQHPEPPPEPDRLTTEELQITTADTLPLPDDATVTTYAGWSR